MTPPVPEGSGGPATAAGGGSSRRSVVALLVVLALAAFALVALGASAQRGTVAVFVGEAGQRTLAEFEDEEGYSEPDWDVYTVPPSEPSSEAPSTALRIVLVILAVVILVAVGVLIRRLRALARPPLEEAAEIADEELSEQQARAALDDARERLSRGVDAQDAVIEAWLALEQAIARAGVPRDRAQTTLEFVVAVLGALDLDRTALDRLAHLYRRALFDDSPLAEGDRTDAHRQLDRLVAQLTEDAR
ncbi:DUF4129 domain-containing protein [Brachybacterium sp. AOP43-C2-M15]|uniref:DUF4129 domain-containing protein n=1 Tax=Brachybacterium sp. AOP43-C2-M15 TaxID=3457661 RepID=UPI00403363CC